MVRSIQNVGNTCKGNTDKTLTLQNCISISNVDELILFGFGEQLKFLKSTKNLLKMSQGSDKSYK